MANSIRYTFCRNDYLKIKISSILNELKKTKAKFYVDFFVPDENEERYFSWTNAYRGCFYLLFEDIEL